MGDQVEGRREVNQKYAGGLTVREDVGTRTMSADTNISAKDVVNQGMDKETVPIEYEMCSEGMCPKFLRHNL